MDWKLLLQIAGVALGLLYLWLEYRANIWLWVVGLIMPAVHGTLYFKSGLYADFSMQAYYMLASLYGLAVWYRTRNKEDKRGKSGNDGSGSGKNQSDDTSGIIHTPARLVLPLIAIYAVLHAGIYLLLEYCTDSTVPFWDAMTTALSVVAMWMLSKKHVEQWLVWLAVDIITVALYIYKGIPVTAGLYALYSLLAMAGYIRWRRMCDNMAH